MLTLLGGQPKPSRAMAEIVTRGARILQIEAGEIVLRIRIGPDFSVYLPCVFPFLKFSAFFTPSPKRDYRTHAIARDESDAKRKQSKSGCIHLTPIARTAMVGPPFPR
jgi:hypothetical protein